MAWDEQTTLGDLEAGKPTRDDPIEEGADHIRQLKRTLKRSFAGFDGTVLLQGVVARGGEDLGVYPVRIDGVHSVVLTAGSLLLFQADKANLAHARVYLNQQVLMPWMDAAEVALSAGRVRAGEWTLSVFDGAAWRLLSQADVAGLTAALEARVDAVEREARTREASLTQQVEALGVDVREAKMQAEGLQDEVLEAIRKNFSAGIARVETRLNGVEAKAAEVEGVAKAAKDQAENNREALEANALPAQSGQAGYYLSTDGKQAEWRVLPGVDGDDLDGVTAVAEAAKEQAQSAVDQVVELATQVQGNQAAIEQNREALEANALPAQSGQAGRYLSTDGQAAKWEVLPVPSGAVADEAKAQADEAKAQADKARERVQSVAEKATNLEAKVADNQTAIARHEQALERQQSAIEKNQDVLGDQQATLDRHNQAIEGNALPAQSGQAGHYLTTDGSEAAWRALPASSSVDEGALKDAVKADLKASFSHELRAVEAKLNAVEQEVAQAEGTLTEALETERGRITRNRRKLNVLDSQVKSHTLALQGVNDRLLGQAVIPRRWAHYHLLRASAVNDGANFRWEVPRGVYQVGVACWGAGGKQAYEVGYAGAGGAGFAFGVFGVEPGQLLGGFRVGTDENDGMTVYGEYLQAHRGGDAVYRDFVSVPGEGGKGVVTGAVAESFVAKGGRGGDVIQQMPSDDEGAKPTQYGELLVTVGGGGGGAGSFYGDGGAGGDGVSGAYVGSGGGGGGFGGSGGLGQGASACGAGGGGACERVLGGHLACGGAAGQRAAVADKTGAHWEHPWGLGGGGGGGSGSAGQAGRQNGWVAMFSTGGHGGSGLNGEGGAGALLMAQAAGRGVGYGDCFLDLAHRCLGGGGGGGANVYHARGGDGGPGGGGGGSCVTLPTYAAARAGMGGLGGGGGGAGVCPVYVWTDFESHWSSSDLSVPSQGLCGGDSLFGGGGGGGGYGGVGGRCLLGGGGMGGMRLLDRSMVLENVRSPGCIVLYW
ncbi:MAG: hypothetical protein N0C80_15160 [Candidatus Thiodiazotropha endolucinida]|nr:hypothetical protein [Candidatus Thiodiazotropha taylori]MCW4272244.1 hypothetical protein [Candidatus Thiodiazotropha endolucinida]